LQKRVTITDDDNAGSLHDKLMLAGAALLVETITGLAAGSLREIQQSNVGVLLHAPKIFKEDMGINWKQSGVAIQNFIKGLSPYPGAFTMLEDKLIKIYRSHFVIQAHDRYGNAIFGNGYKDVIYETDHKTYLRFATPDGWVYIDELQQEGKKRMAIEDFLRGFRTPNP